jgi:transposase
MARLLTVGRDRLSKVETVVVAAIEGGVALLVEARTIVADFQAMIRGKSLADLDPWLERARSSLVASFANGVTKDKAAVYAAISSAWSNGQTEGQITKLKLPPFRFSWLRGGRGCFMWAVAKAATPAQA